MRRRAVLNVSSNVGGTLFVLVVWFVVTPIIVHRLGATQYGLWVLATTIVSYAALLDIGIGDAVTRHIALYRAGQDSERTESTIGAALWISGGMALIALALTALLIPFFISVFNVPSAEHDRAIAVLVFSGLNVAIALPAITNLAILRGLQRFDLVNVVSAGSAVVMGVAIVIVLHLGGDVVAIAAIGAALELLAQVPMFLLIRHAAPDLNVRLGPPGWANVREVLSFGVTQSMIRIGRKVRLGSDELFVGNRVAASGVTTYALVRRLSDFPLVVSDQFVDTLLPLSSELHASNDTGRLQQLFLAGTRMATGACLLVGVSVALLASPFLSAWVGSTSSDVAVLALLLVGSRVFDAAVRPAEVLLVGRGNLRAVRTTAWVTAPLKVALAIALGIAFGVRGIAAATLLATAVHCVPIAVAGGRAVGVGLQDVLREAVAPILVAATAAISAVLVTKHVVGVDSLVKVVVCGACGCIAFVAAYALLPVTALERDTFREILARSRAKK